MAPSSSCRSSRMDLGKQIIGVSIVALALIVVIGCVSWINGTDFVATKTNEFQHNQLNFVRQVAGKVQTNFERLHNALYAISQVPTVQFLDINACLLNMIRTFKMNDHLVEGIFRVDATSQVRYVYPPNVEFFTQAELQPLVHHARMTGASQLHALRRHHDDTDVLVIARPVYTVQGEVHLNPSNKFAGLLLFTISLRRLQEQFLDVPVFDKNGALWVLDADGLLLATVHQAHRGKLLTKVLPDFATGHGRQQFLQLVAQMRQGEEGMAMTYGGPHGPGAAQAPPDNVEQYVYRRDKQLEQEVEQLTAFTPLHVLNQTWSIAVSNPKTDVALSIQTALIEQWFHSIGFSVTVLGLAGLLIFILRSNHQQQLAALQEGEEARREAEEKYRTLVEHATDAILILQHGKTAYRNPSYVELLGYDVEETVGGNFLEFVVPEDRDTVREYYEQRLQGAEVPEQYEVGVQTREGTRTLEVKPRVIQYQGDQATMVVMRDITERRRLETRLRQSHKLEAIGRLAGGIAHDFNNILLAILGYSEMTRDDLPEGSLTRENLEHVLKAGYRAKDLVKQILAFSRQYKQEREAIHIAPLVEEALTLLRASLPSTIDICQDLDTTCGTVLAGPTQIHQVIMNLCTNASHAMGKKGGVLEVRLAKAEVDADFADHNGAQQGPYIRLTVSDTGCGMTPDIIERIFDPFFTTKAIGEGTGMGLAAVHGIVESTGGAITVSSELGKGTTFHVLFPRIESHAMAIPGVVAPIPKGKERVLLVDDEEELVHMGRQMLERLGYEVVATTRSLEALELFRAQPEVFDVVLTDQTMPDMTGDDLARELLRIRPDIPIILVTGFSQDIEPEHVYELGIREFIMKPMTARDLSEAIQRVLQPCLEKEGGTLNGTHSDHR